MLKTEEKKSIFQNIPHFDEAHKVRNPGLQLKMMKEAIPSFKKWFKQTGKASAFHSCDLILAPYPTKSGLFRAGSSPTPFIWFTNRMFIVQWEAEGRTWTMLNEPTETVLVSETPFYASLKEKFGDFLAHKVFSKEYAKVEDYLKLYGLEPEDIDYITYDHLHTRCPTLVRHNKTTS